MERRVTNVREERGQLFDVKLALNYRVLVSATFFVTNFWSEKLYYEHSGFMGGGLAPVTLDNQPLDFKLFLLVLDFVAQTDKKQKEPLPVQQLIL